MKDPMEPDRPSVRISRRQALGGISSGLLAAALAPEAAADPKGSPPPRGETVTALGRRGCTVTPLQSGLLLVAGGYRTQVTGASQIYDAQRGVWYDAAPMRTPRLYHAAAPLHDGRVLVAGGQFMEVLSSAEIYDPRTDAWSPAAPMNGPRAEHGAAPMNGIQIVVTGGFYRAPLSSVEIYDPRSDQWLRL